MLFLLSAVNMASAQESKSDVSEADVAKNDTYIEVLTAIGETYKRPHSKSANSFGLGFRFGNEWYQKKKSKYKLGFNVIWTSIIFGFHKDAAYVQFLPLNIGISNNWELSEKRAIELNLNAGFAIQFIEAYQSSGNGFSINPEVKLHFNKTALGIAYQFVYSIHANNWGTFTSDSHLILLSFTLP